MTAGRSSRWREHSRSARQDSPLPGSPLPGHVPAARTAPATGRARRRRVVTATGIGGAGLLGISLSTKAGSPRFYLLTMGLAGAWAAGALSAGPLPLNMTQGRDDARRHPVVMPVLTGAAAFGLFYGAAQLARHIPPLNRSIGSVLRYADDGSTPLVLLTACANAVAEELFFRGALWSLVQDSHPLAKTTLAYGATTAATRNPALVLAGTATSVLFGLQRRTSGGILGSGDVLMPEAEYFASPAAGLVQQGEEEAVPQPGAGVEDRLRLGGGQDLRQLLRDLERDGPAAIGLVLADGCRNGFQPPRPPVLQTASRSPTSAPFWAWRPARP